MMVGEANRTAGHEQTLFGGVAWDGALHLQAMVKREGS